MKPSLLLQVPFLFVFVSPGSSQSSSLVSASSQGVLGNGRSEDARVSADGTCVAFQSLATNLVPGVANVFTSDIYVRELETGQTSRVSISSNGVEANGSSMLPDISADGRFVTFSSVANNLVIGDTNGVNDVFLHDRALGLTTLVSVDSFGAQGASGSGAPVITANGGAIAFISGASNLVTADSNQAQDVFVHETSTGVTERVSLSTAGVQGTSACYDLAISGDGRYVAFESSASEFVTGDTNDVSDIFVRDRQTGLTTRISVGPAGVQADGGSWGPSLSHDGRYVAFTSFASNLVNGSVSGTLSCYVHDQLTGTTSLVSVDSYGAPAAGICEDAVISSDGRHVTFSSMAATLVAGDNNETRDIFVHDRLLGLTIRTSIGAAGSEADGFNECPAISADGRVVVFDSRATNIVGGDDNGFADVFVRDRAIGGGGLSCGGSAAPGSCPCGNVGAPGEGCSNTSGWGATLARYGTASIANDDLRFVAEQLSLGKPALLFSGSALVGGGQGNYFGDGLRCVGNSIIRIGVQVSDGQGVAMWGPGLATAHGWSVGESRHFQVFYRDAANSPCGSGFNTTPAHSVTLN